MERTTQADEQTISRLCFDEIAYVQGKTSDLDWDFIEKLFHHVHKKVTIHNAQSMGLITKKGTKEYPTFGGIILFGLDRLTLFPEAIIRCARFLGTNKHTILDQATIEIYPPLALEEAMKFIQRNTRLGAEIKELARKDIPEYPPAALREAIINAIVHSDYAVKGVHISIAIFDDRIEITSPGGLPFGFTIEKALAGSSRIRNRTIAKVFHHMKWIEQWGSGLLRIIKECEQRGLEEPKFEELNNQFRVTLFAEKKSSSTRKKASIKAAVTKKKKTPVILEQWQKELINHLKKKKKISSKEAAELWNVTVRAALTRLTKLVNMGIIQKIGTSSRDPQGGYILLI